MKQTRERKWNFLTAMSLAGALTLSAWMGLQADDRAAVLQPVGHSVAGAGSAATPGRPDRAHFMGARSCIDCHRSEYVSWLKTAHYNNKAVRVELKPGSIATKYRDVHGNNDLCYTCHALPQEQRYGRPFVESGTSCESCHGAAGGDDGWLNLHAVYGPNITRMEQESPEHLATRLAACEAAGMVRPERQYDVAKNCLGCHIVGHEALAAAGHKTSFDQFSLIPYLAGEVRHNFHQDQRHNAAAPSLNALRRVQSSQDRDRVYFIVEQLARMEVAFRNLSRLSGEEALEEPIADDMRDIVEDAAGQLEEFVEVLLEVEDADGNILNEGQIQSVQDAVDVFADFDEQDAPTRDDAAQLADRIDGLATIFLQQHQGQALGALDEEFLQDLEEPKGEAVEP